MVKVLFVCLGNICRSPMAQFVFQKIVDDMGLSCNFEINSAATESWNEIHHEGIYFGTREILKAKNIPFVERYSRQIRKSDYSYYDYIIAMDDTNIKDIQLIVGSDIEHKICRLLDFTDNPRNIKDPWYTGNFEECYKDIVEGCEAFLKSLRL